MLLDAATDDAIQDEILALGLLVLEAGGVLRRRGEDQHHLGALAHGLCCLGVPVRGVGFVGFFIDDVLGEVAKASLQALFAFLTEVVVLIDDGELLVVIVFGRELAEDGALSHVVGLEADDAVALVPHLLSPLLMKRLGTPAAWTSGRAALLGGVPSPL